MKTRVITGIVLVALISAVICISISDSYELIADALHIRCDHFCLIRHVESYRLAINIPYGVYFQSGSTELFTQCVLGLCRSRYLQAKECPHNLVFQISKHAV